MQKKKNGKQRSLVKKKKEEAMMHFFGFTFNFYEKPRVTALDHSFNLKARKAMMHCVSFICVDDQFL